MSKPKKPTAELELDLAALQRLYDAASCGPWRVHSSGGLHRDNIYITGLFRSWQDDEGPIASVNTERLIFKSRRDRDSTTERKEIKRAKADAELIVAAVNALPELLRRAGYDGAESAWLIERRADDYGPVRWWAAGRDQFVIDANKATRFARKDDAEAVIRAEKLSSVSATEHLWTEPQKREKLAA